MAVEGAGLDIPVAIKKGDTIKFVGDVATDPFPKLQRKCATAKSGLTKALTALEKTSLGFDRLTQEEGFLTKQRKPSRRLRPRKLILRPRKLILKT